MALFSAFWMHIHAHPPWASRASRTLSENKDKSQFTTRMLNVYIHTYIHAYIYTHTAFFLYTRPRLVRWKEAPFQLSFSMHTHCVHPSIQSAIQPGKRWRSSPNMKARARRKNVTTTLCLSESVGRPHERKHCTYETPLALALRTYPTIHPTAPKEIKTESQTEMSPLCSSDTSQGKPMPKAKQQFKEKRRKESSKALILLELDLVHSFGFGLARLGSALALSHIHYIILLKAIHSVILNEKTLRMTASVRAPLAHTLCMYVTFFIISNLFIIKSVNLFVCSLIFWPFRSPSLKTRTERAARSVY